MHRLVLALFAALTITGASVVGCNHSKRVYANCYCAAPITSVTVTVVTSTVCAPCQGREDQEDREGCRRGRCGHGPFDKDCKKGKKDRD